MNSTVPREICHTPVDIHGDQLAELNTIIEARQWVVGLVRDEQLWLESTLFVDKELLAAEALNGRKTGFERLFGHVEWEGYLAAQEYCDNYGNKPATPAFFLGIHREFLWRQAPHVAGTYATGRYTGLTKGPNGERLPIRYSESEVREITMNPLLHLEVVGDDPYVGFLHYESRSPEQHEAAIRDVCEWYNDSRACTEPVALAALLERKLVERHAYAFGVCGRVARMAMKWSLLNSNCSPSALLSFNNDILVPERQWVAEVERGCERYEEMEHLTLYNQIDPIDFFGLRPQAIILKQHDVTPPPRLEPGYHHNRKACADFIAHLGGPDFATTSSHYTFGERGIVVQIDSL